ncbi:MAG: ferric reductase-like transmembrane domain-containing protein [Candidatus Helarchaeota archaeon]|nr:ferric reductase-like transmembrane domain-containing protein [Candidatus Helarchaeota archaeon]
MKRFLMMILGLNLGIIIVFWLISSGSSLLVDGSDPVSLGNFFLALGRLFGLSGMLFVLFQLILIGRTSWVEQRYGHDALAKIHQENGRIALGLLIVHPIFLILGQSWAAGLSFGDGFLNLVQTKPLVIFAPIGLIILFTIVLISNPLIMKRVKYEHWYYFHLFMYSAIALVIGHQFFAGTDFAKVPAFLGYWIALYVFVIGNFMVYRLMKPLLLYRQHKFVVDRRIQETHDTVSLHIKGGNMDQFSFLPGQFLLMRFLWKGLWWQVHPFSISACPNGQEVRITVKAEGDYTKALVQINPGTRVVMDGPLGRFTRIASKREKVLFIAAGVGITPIRSVMEDLALLGKNLLLIYGNKTSKDIIFQEELETLSKKYKIPIHYFLSREKAVPPVNAGRIDLQAIQRLVPDLQEREIFLCGPVEMMRSLRISLAKIKFPSEHIHFEKFNW